MNNSTNPIIIAASAELGASEIAVIDGDIILSMIGGGACAVGRIEGREVIHAQVNGREPDHEWKTAVEAALAPHALENTRWHEFHELYALGEHGYILLFADGSLCHISSGTSFRGFTHIAAVRCPGPGQIDRTYYAEGWTSLNEDRTYTVKEDGRIITEEDMIKEAIRDGDWDSFYDFIREEFTESAASFIR